MKLPIAAALFLLLTSLHAYCRIGETLAELIARFGEGKKDTGRVRMAGHDQYYFEKDGIGVQCVISNDKCVMEVFHRLDTKITDQDIKELLKIEADGHGWGFNPRTKRWLRSDNKLTAYRELNHEDMFFLEDMATKKENETVTKGKAGF